MSWPAPGPNSPPCGTLNTFDCSIRHVSHLLDAAYGHITRYVPAHAQHLVDRDIVASMHSKFYAQFEATSAARFRKPTDMQFAFAYYYYIIQEQRWRNEIVPGKLAEVEFFMVQDKSSRFAAKLEQFKRWPRKFACFNDDIDYSKPNLARKLRQTLAGFFESMFPAKSEFEL